MYQAKFLHAYNCHVSQGILGLSRGLEPEKILGVIYGDCLENLLLVVKWKDNHIADRVQYYDFKEKYTEMLIDYFRGNIEWLGEHEQDHL